MFGALLPGEVSPTRVAAQVVSGIGFLGAGLIFKEGLSVRGLNTAATLWCPAAIGVLSGAGSFAHAVLATVLIIDINLLLRPAMIWINQRLPVAPAEVDQAYGVSVVWPGRMRPTCEFCFSRAWLPTTCTSSSLTAPISKAATECQ